MEIRFGTDGWRGVIAQDFTFDNVAQVSQAIADYIVAHGKTRTLVVGYDTRFLSEQFAQEVACVLAANGIRTYLTETFTPTPAVSYSVKTLQTDGAIMVTASHNPPQYNGLKFKAPYAGSAGPEMTLEIESYLKYNLAFGRDPLKADLQRALSQERVVKFNPKDDYIECLRKLVDFEKIRDSKLKIVIDPMHGAAIGYLAGILSELDCDVTEIRNCQNPYFGGVNPEPIAINLDALSEAVLETKSDIGVATDADGDRIGAMDANGRFVTAHQIFALLLQYLADNRGLRGSVIKTVSTSRMIDILCKQLSLQLHVTPIGFKNICDFMLNEDVLIGGEESGGIGVKGHIPERDGILAGLLLFEMLATANVGLAEMLDELMSHTAHLYYDRIDLHTSDIALNGVIERLNNIDIGRVNGNSVVNINRMDGTKLILDDGSWLLLRPSGTEPLLRIYAESNSPAQVNELLDEGRKIVNL